MNSKNSFSRKYISLYVSLNNKAINTNKKHMSLENCILSGYH